MTIVINEKAPACKATGNTFNRVNNSLNSDVLKSDLKDLIQEAFEAGIMYKRDDHVTNKVMKYVVGDNLYTCKQLNSTGWSGLQIESLTAIKLTE